MDDEARQLLRDFNKHLEALQSERDEQYRINPLLGQIFDIRIQVLADSIKQTLRELL